MTEQPVEFETGDIVSLKSGGPAMTVFERHDDGLFAVEWFVGGELHRDRFHPAELVRVNEQSETPQKWLDPRIIEVGGWAGCRNDFESN